MELNVYLFDTYALFELIRYNSGYEKFKKGTAIITTKLNLMELYYGLLLSFDIHVAEFYYNKYSEQIIEIDDETIKQAMLFKFQNRKKNLSYVDCIGYVAAIKNNLLFLTGDKEFANMAGVEFVK